MSQLKEIGIETVRSENTSFWTSGNAPTQSAFQLDFAEVLLHVKALYLLTDRIVAASSFFFESEITRQITLDLAPLFTRGELVYFVDSEVEDFEEHGDTKIVTSPEELNSYNDPSLVKDRAEELSGLGYILKRPSCSISDKIVDIWIRDIQSTEPGSLGVLLAKYFPNENERLDLVGKLVIISRDRGRASFVWEYLGPKLILLKLPPPILRASKHRLSTMYAQATSEVLGLGVDRHELTLAPQYIQQSSCFDSGIFLRCMGALGIQDSLSRLDAHQLIRLKYSPEFVAFKDFYFILIRTVGLRAIDAANWIVKYRQYSKVFAMDAVTVEDFVSAFHQICRALKQDPDRYKNPLEVLLTAYNLTHKLTIDAFIEVIESLEKSARPNTEISIDTSQGSMVYGKSGLILPPPSKDEEFRKIIVGVIENFRLYIEEQGGWRLLWNEGYSSERSEKNIQVLFKGIVQSECASAGISLDAEVDLGRGPVDFKFSNGYRQRAHLEIKKLENSDFWNGLSKQLPSYMRSDRVVDGWLLAVLFRDTQSNSRRIAKLENRVAKTSAERKLNLNFALIDARPKSSASNL
ncbi:MAG: hypothetical protein WKF34_07295 [Pyrinomonadaceae bacterium]